ncbi:MAG TPA: hypothetical protein VFZ89_01160, partial [Solirubrobacteraceae bacterium]
MQFEDLAQVGARPDDRADDRMPCSTVSKIGSFISFSAGRATNTSVPPRRSEPKACSNERGETARAIAWSAPPSFWIAAI